MAMLLIAEEVICILKNKELGFGGF